MKEIKVPVQIDGFKCIEDMVQTVLNYAYKGKTLKEWADSISKPVTNADRIRAMTDDELAEYLIADIEAEAVRRAGRFLTSGEINRAIADCLSWLRKEADNDKA